jgi:signal transduction histidine kinase
VRRRHRDPGWILTLLAGSGALLLCAIMLGTRIVVPSERAVIPTEAWPWTPAGVGVEPLPPESPFLAGDVVLAMNGRSIESWATAAMLPWTAPPSDDRGLGDRVTFDVRRSGDVVRIVAPRLGFAPERVGGASLGLLAFGAGALLLAALLLARRPQSTPLRILFVATAANAADIVAWEIDLHPTDLAAETPFLLAFGLSALCGLLFWSCLVHLLLVYPVRSRYAEHRGGVPAIYAGPIAVFLVGLAAAWLAGGGVLAWIDRLASLVGGIASTMLALVVVATLAGYRRTPESRRRQVRLIAVTLIFAAVADLVLITLPITVGGQPITSRNTAAILALPVPVAVILAVIRDRLFQVNLLAGSRERIVAAREEERRRLRRELHDGLGPTLAAIGLKVDLARGQVRADPAAAEAALDDARAALKGVVADVRRLARDLRPPALDSLGLVGAIRQQADGLTGSLGTGPAIMVVAPEPFPVLPAATEVAAYRIAVEGLMNVIRHAGATRCDIRLGLEPAGLTIDIVDDGRGLPDGASGVGTSSIHERAAEIGGEVTIRRIRDGGTHLSAQLPFIGARDAPLAGTADA